MEKTKFKFAKCLCGMTDRAFRVGPDYVVIDSCKKCNSYGVMIPFEAWSEMRQKKYEKKAVSTTGEVIPF